jgi:hypothetical protein
MRQRGGSNAIAELRWYWRRWTNVVELFARSRRARKKVDPQNYEAIHADLIEACRAISSLVDDEDRAYFEKLEHIALPWVSTRSFEHTNREVLSELYTRCRQVERELGGRRLTSPTLHHPLRVVLTAAATAGVVLLIWNAGAASLPIFDHHQSWWETLVMCIDQTRYVRHLIIPGVIVVTVSSFVISRTARA